MKKRSQIGLMAMLIVLAVTACSSNNAARDISKVLGIDLSRGTLVQSTDSHGGFHGDGIAYTEMTFNGDESQSIVEEIEDNTGWSGLPLTDSADTLVYGKKNGLKAVGPYITNIDGEPLFPAIENGYYFFLDRHSNVKNGEDILNRSSFNFTIAMYDADTKTLYYCEMDT